MKTKQLEGVIAHAKLLAGHYGQPTVTPGLLLIALMDYTDDDGSHCLARALLDRLGVNLPSVRIQVSQGWQQYVSAEKRGDKVDFDSDANVLFEDASNQRRQLGHVGYLDTEHLLLAIIRKNSMHASHILSEAGVHHDFAVFQLLDLIEDRGLSGAA